MRTRRQWTIFYAAAALVGIWVVATAGYFISQRLKVTAEKVQAFVAARDLNSLSGAERARAIEKLAAMLNQLPAEERQRLRLERTADKWFGQMTEAEKGTFIEATLPTGFKQMISAFEQLPEDKRRRAVDEAMKRLRETGAKAEPGARPGGRGGADRPPISPELEEKVREIGLKTFFSQSSAQTKAELAPLLEEIQRAMESGRLMRRR